MATTKYKHVEEAESRKGCCRFLWIFLLVLTTSAIYVYLIEKDFGHLSRLFIKESPSQFQKASLQSTHVPGCPQYHDSLSEKCTCHESEVEYAVRDNFTTSNSLAILDYQTRERKNFNRILRRPNYRLLARRPIRPALHMFSSNRFSLINRSRRRRFWWHTPPKFYSDQDIQRLTSMPSTHQYNFNKTLSNILKVRVSGTPGHNEVKQFIISSMQEMNFAIELDEFIDSTPKGDVKFSNIIATHNPKACKRLIFACHYDSKFDKKGKFLGATDSAAPCAMLIEMARNILPYLNNKKNDEITLQFIFFDGEEAFERWTDTDSLYGSRHLAAKWNAQKYSQSLYYQEGCANKGIVSELDRIELFVLLDILGAPNPRFYSFFEQTNPLFVRLFNIEKKLNELGSIYRNGRSTTQYFQSRMNFGGVIQDDHVPFLKRDVPILHIIPNPFPSVWHKISDNRSILHDQTIINLMKIFQLFIASYLHL